MHFYDFVSYCSMLTDEGRLDAYVKALKDTINEDSVVLDLGAGTGIFTILACDFGAKKVYSVEVNPLIKLLSEVIEERGYADRIEVIQEMSNKIELEEKANVLVSDIHGAFPLFESSIETIIDARERLLVPGGAMIPRWEKIFFAVTQCEEIYESNVKRYLQDFHGFSIPSAERLVFNRWFSARSEEEKLLSEPQMFAEIDYRVVTETSYEQEFAFTVTEDGTVHGLRGWFENELSDDNGVSNAYDVMDSTYSSPFFPLQRPVDVKEGDTVRAKVTAKYEKGDYAWSWKTDFLKPGSETPFESFNQSVLASMYIEPEVVLKQSEYFVPNKNDRAEIDLLVLSSMDGEAMHGDIADALIEKFPDEFESFEQALEYTASMSHRYSG